MRQSPLPTFPAQLTNSPFINLRHSILRVRYLIFTTPSPFTVSSLSRFTISSSLYPKVEILHHLEFLLWLVALSIKLAPYHRRKSVSASISARNAGIKGLAEKCSLWQKDMLRGFSAPFGYAQGMLFGEYKTLLIRRELSS